MFPELMALADGLGVLLSILSILSYLIYLISSQVDPTYRRLVRNLAASRYGVRALRACTRRRGAYIRSPLCARGGRPQAPGCAARVGARARDTGVFVHPPVGSMGDATDYTIMFWPLSRRFYSQPFCFRPVGDQGCSHFSHRV